MKSVLLLDTAEADLLNIYSYIAERSGHVTVADGFIEKLHDYCYKLGSIPGTIGRARPELRPDIRSAVYKNYVVLFRYVDEHIEIVNILEGHRDIGAFFDDPESTKPPMPAVYMLLAADHHDK